MDAGEWNDEWRSALADQRDEEMQAGRPRVVDGFMILGDPDDDREAEYWDHREEGR